jgi:hypothetical protein
VIIQSAEIVKAKALARLTEAEAQLATATGEAPLKADAAARVRDEARAAEAEKVSAAEASREAAGVWHLRLALMRSPGS